MPVPETLVLPRLVRTSPFPEADIKPLTDIPVWQELAKLADFYKDTEQFMTEVVGFIHRYGVLDPYRGMDSLLEWEDSVARVWAFVQLRKLLADSPVSNPSEMVEGIKQELTERWERKWSKRLRPHEVEQEALNSRISYPLSVLAQTAEETSTIGDLRRRIGEHLLLGFSGALLGHLVFTWEGLQAEVGAWAWVQFELAQLYLGTEAMQTCPGCGALFVPRHGKQKYCDPASTRCRGKSFRRRKGAVSRAG